MGADYINTTLYCLGERVEADEGYPFSLDRTLSWSAGEARIRDWCSNLDEDGLAFCVEEEDIVFEGATSAERRTELADAMLQQLRALRASLLGSREVACAIWPMAGTAPLPGIPLVHVRGDRWTVIEFSTGGMTWGDLPTEAFGLFTYFYEPCHSSARVLEAVGFLNPSELAIAVATEPDEART